MTGKEERCDEGESSLLLPFESSLLSYDNLDTGHRNKVFVHFQVAY